MSGCAWSPQLAPNWASVRSEQNRPAQSNTISFFMVQHFLVRIGQATRTYPLSFTCPSLFQSKDEPEEGGERVAEESSFRGWILRKCSSRRGGGNVESASLLLALSKEEKNPRSCPTGILRFRHFHGRFAGSRNSSNNLRFACCMRWAASVSLRVAAMRCKTATVSPGRRYCAGLGKANSVSSGVW